MINNITYSVTHKILFVIVRFIYNKCYNNIMIFKM